MIDNVVVRPVYAATVWPGLERPHHTLRRSIERDRGDGEARGILPESIEIHTWREIRAGRGDRAAVGAPSGYLGTDRIASEMRERARRRDLYAPTEHPHEEVEIVAALRQDHRAALRLLPPVAPYVAVGEVPVDEVLPPVDRDDRAETIGREDLANRGEERRVAQHVRDLQEAPVRLGRGRDLETFTGRGRDRLFEQHFVAGREQTESARAVMPL